MLINVKNNSDDEIHFYPKTITDGMKIGIMREKIHKQGMTVRLEMDGDEVKCMSIKQKDLLDILC